MKMKTLEWLGNFDGAVLTIFSCIQWLCQLGKAQLGSTLKAQ